MASKTNTCKVADLEFDGIGRRYEDFMHQGLRMLEYIIVYRSTHRACSFV